MFGFLKRRRRARIRARPFPPEWLAIVQRNVPMYGRLPEADHGDPQRNRKGFQHGLGGGLRDVAQVLRDGGVGDRDPMFMGFLGFLGYPAG